MLDKFFSSLIKSTVPPEILAQTNRDIQPAYGEDNLGSYAASYEQHPWVYSTIFEVSTSCSSIPLNVLFKDSPIEQGPIIDLFNRPNPWMTGRDFKEAHFIFMESMGECFWYMVGERDEPISRSNPPVEVYLLRPDRVTVIPDKEEYIAGFEYSINGEDVLIPADKVVYFKYFSPTKDHRGLSPLKPAELSITSDLNAQKYNSVFFENASVPTGMFVNKEKTVVGKDAFDRLKKQLQEAFASVKKWHKPLVVDGYEYVDTAKKFKDMEFSVLRKTNKEEIAGTTGVPMSAIGDRSQMNRSTSETEERRFYEGTIIPKLKKYEDALTAFIAPYFGDFIFKHDFSGIAALSAGFEEKFDALTGAVNTWILPSEARKIAKKQFGFQLDEIDDIKFEREPTIKKKDSNQVTVDITKLGYPDKKNMKIAI